MGQIFDFLFVNPMANALLGLYDLLGQNYVFALIVLTVIIKLLTLPLTLKQQVMMAKQSALAPVMKEIQEKYKSDPQKMQAEMRKLGFNPLSGCLPLLIQMPILIALFNAINRTLTVDPRSLLDLGKHVYGWLPNLSTLVPVNSQFLIWDLGQPDKLYLIPLLVVATTFLSNKLMMPASQPGTDPAVQQTNQMMQWMMPIMFGFFMLTSPVGLGIYWLVSNLLGIAQYYITKPNMDRAKAQYASLVPAAAGATAGATGSGKSASAAALPPPPPPRSKVRGGKPQAKPDAGKKGGGK
jgi:YidC/Oxa1 family membrane protein insertase